MMTREAAERTPTDDLGRQVRTQARRLRER